MASTHIIVLRRRAPQRASVRRWGDAGVADGSICRWLPAVAMQACGRVSVLSISGRSRRVGNAHGGGAQQHAHVSLEGCEESKYEIAMRNEMISIAIRPAGADAQRARRIAHTAHSTASFLWRRGGGAGCAAGLMRRVSDVAESTGGWRLAAGPRLATAETSIRRLRAGGHGPMPAVCCEGYALTR